MPVLHTNDITTEFQARWRQWQIDIRYFTYGAVTTSWAFLNQLVRQRHGALEEARVKPLKGLLAIFVGDPVQLESTAESWPELLLATITYCHPTMKCTQIKYVPLNHKKYLIPNSICTEKYLRMCSIPTNPWKTELWTTLRSV